MIIKRYIPAPYCGSQSIAQNTFIPYIKGIEQMFLDAGLVKSNTSTNIDTDNIQLPNVRNTGYNYMSKVLEFDLNDSMQVTNPFRIGMQFGTYWDNSATSSSYGVYPIFLVCKTYVINGITNERVITSNSTYMYGYTTRYAPHKYTTSGDYQAEVYDARADSFIIAKDGFFAMCLSPGYDQYNQSADNVHRPESSLFSLVIERCGENINVLCPGTSQTSLDGIVGYTYRHGAEAIRTDSLTHYTDNGIVYQNGKIVVFPKYIVDENNYIEQSKNVVIVNADTLNHSSEIDLIVNNDTAKFIAMPGKHGKFFKNTGRILVRYDDVPDITV